MDDALRILDLPGTDVSRTVAARLADELREQIFTGEIAPGTRLMQNHVASQFNVSSTPVREAFAELIRDGLVRSAPRRGVEVMTPTLEAARHASDLQMVLEQACIAASAPNLTDAQLERSWTLLEAHRNVRPGQRREGFRRDFQFHASLLEGCTNPRLLALAKKSRADTIVFRLVLFPAEVDRPSSEFMRTLWAHHEAIYDACAQRDGEKAAQRLGEHIRFSAQVFAESE